MPELPEVETTRRGIEPHLVGQTVLDVKVREHRLRWPVSPELGQMLSGKCIQEVSRRGKYLLIGIESGRVMVHLGMSGSLRILPAASEPQKHDHIDVVLHNGTLLRYRDPRRFGSWFWLQGDNGHDLIDHLGPEPLTETFDVEYLFARARGKKVPIKQFIMDSKIVVGVGNIYANEALFAAGILPTRPAGGVSKQRYASLITHIKRVLAEAIEAGGTSLRDFVREDGNPGYFRHDLKVYGRGELPCLQCQRSLKEIRLGQRTTVFCTRCQS